MRRQLLNNVNTGIDFATADNEIKKWQFEYLAIHNPIKVVVPTGTATLTTSNETFSVSQKPSLSSSKLEDMEEDTPKRKENISGNHIIDVNIILVVFLVRCYVLNV